MINSSSNIGRPPLRNSLKRKHIVKLYLNDTEFQEYETLKNRLSSSSPALSMNDFFRLIVVNHDINGGRLFELFNISFVNPLTNVLFKTKRDYNKKANMQDK